MEKKILIIPVNYNSYDSLKNYVESLEKAYNNVESKYKVTVSVIVADNSTIQQDFIFPHNSKIEYNINHQDNYGYLGGAIRILNKINEIDTYDYIIISNVDLTLDPLFLNSLLSSIYEKNIAWIAPKIFSLNENRDKNPKILNRYSLNKLKILKFLYRYPILHKIYQKTLYQRKKIHYDYPPQNIYAGHGSLIILKGQALSQIMPLFYPVFLFGEECFLAEKLREVGMSVYYDPSLKVIDQEHASTGEMKSKFYYKCNEEALNYIISEFYE